MATLQSIAPNTQTEPIAPPTAPKPNAAENEAAKRECLSREGEWKWSPQTNTCTKLITSANSTPEEYEAYKLSKGLSPTDKSKFGALRDSESGRLSGFEEGGNTYLGLQPERVRESVEAEANKQELVVGGQAETVLSNRQQQEEGLRAAAGVARTPLDPGAATEQIKLNYVDAALSAIPGILPEAIGFGGTFAAGALVAGQLGPQAALPEEVVTVPAAAIIGAVIGGVKGFYQDFVRNLEQQRSAAVEAPIRTLTETKPLLSDIINAQNGNPEDRDKHRQQFDIQTQLIQDDYDNLKDLTDSSVTKLLGENGINQLKEFQVYYAGEAQQLELEFQDALANPDPAKIRATSKDIEDMKQRITGLIK